MSSSIDCPNRGIVCVLLRCPLAIVLTSSEYSHTIIVSVNIMHHCIQCEPKSLIRDQTIHNKDSQVDVESLDLVGAVQHGALDRVVSLYQRDAQHIEGKVHAGNYLCKGPND